MDCKNTLIAVDVDIDPLNTFHNKKIDYNSYKSSHSYIFSWVNMITSYKFIERPQYNVNSLFERDITPLLFGFLFC